MKDGPAFQFYASDFYMDTNGWTATQIGIYLRLLMYEWVNEYLPNNTEQLARIAQVDHGNFLKCYRPTVEGKFYPNGNGNLVNRRLEEEREKQRKYRESQKQKGIKGAEIRWDKGIPDAMPVPSPDTSPKHSSSSSSSYNNKYYRDERQNYVCLSCLKSWQKYENFKSHKCGGKDELRQNQDPNLGQPEGGNS